jgi:dienelactone hydrolase
VILVKVGLRMLLHMHRGHAAPAPPPPVPAAAAVNPHGPIALPAFPDPGPGQALEAGVAFHEIRLPNGPKPGSGKRLWLYLPPGAPANHALPCVLITGAGSPLVLGMDLGPGDRPEHLPYVRAGFAVLAFELDGGLNGVQNASDAQFFAAARRFLAARAGLANARIALEYVLAKVPQVDPQRVFVAGHSSAGTLALLFAEHEPRLKGCVAFAPPIDLAQRLHQLAPALRQQGLIDLVERYSPKNNEANLACPLFLFHALDDTNTPVRGSLDCVQRLQGMGKDVTLVTVATGGHYQSMIDEGIPRAIAWLQARAGTEPPGVGAAPPQPAAIPAPAPTPPVPTTNNEPGQWGNPPDGRGGFPIPRRGPRIAPPPHFRGPRFAPPRFAPPGMPPHP